MQSGMIVPLKKKTPFALPFNWNGIFIGKEVGTVKLHHFLVAYSTIGVKAHSMLEKPFEKLYNVKRGHIFSPG